MREFDAVVRHGTRRGRPAVILDRTTFYPTSGGQPYDVGGPGPARVVDVVDADDRVVHVLDVPIAEGTRVRGSIDWDRRFDHMQQHTGQHVLSAAFEHVNGNRTVSFHMGTDLSSIDLEREASWTDIDAAVAAANRVVWEDRPVSIRFVTDAEAATLLRKPPSRDGTLRLIDVAVFDLSACGGTRVGPVPSGRRGDRGREVQGRCSRHLLPAAGTVAAGAPRLPRGDRGNRSRAVRVAG